MAAALIGLGGARAGTARAQTATPAGAHPPAPAARERPKVRLDYERGPEATRCPDGPALARAIAERLGYDPFAPDARSAVRAVITGRGNSLVARIQLIDAAGASGGTREIRSPGRECDELAGAVALAASIAIDPEQGVSLPGPSPSPAPATAEAAAAPPSPPGPAKTALPATGTAATPAEPPTPPNVQGAPWVPYVAVGLFGSVAGQATIPWNAGAEVGLGARRGPLSLELDARLEIPQSASIAQSPAGEVRSTSSLLLLVSCGHWSRAALCAVGALGITWGSARGFAEVHQAALVTAAAGARAQVEWPLGGTWSLRGSAEGLIFGRRAALIVDENTRALATGRVNLTAGVAASARFP